MDGKTRGIVSYITLIGWIIALVTNTDKDRLASFHIRQSLGIMLTAVVVQIVLMLIPFIGWILLPVAGILFLVMWIFGLISAVNGEEKPLPVVGPLYQDWFKGL